MVLHYTSQKHPFICQVKPYTTEKVVLDVKGGKSIGNLQSVSLYG